jgi:glucosamine kinase
MADSYQLGIDIGGSKTQALLARDGAVVADLRTGSANPASVGPTESTRQLSALLDQVRSTGVDLGSITAVCAGAAGVDSPEQVARLTGVLTDLLPRAAARVVHDTELLLAAAGTPTGIALIAGTGSVAWGRTADARQARAGGWGYVLGDEGSGYGIARAAVRHTLELLDTGLAPDQLALRLAEACGLERPALLLDHFYALPERRYWAERSRVVFELAEDSDPAASTVVADAADALAALVTTVAARLGGTPGPVVLAGGVLVHQPLARQLLADRLRPAGITQLRLLEADPALGAVRLAEALRTHSASHA